MKIKVNKRIKPIFEGHEGQCPCPPGVGIPEGLSHIQALPFLLYYSPKKVLL